MELDKLIEIYQLFFPGKRFETRRDNEEIEVSYIENNAKYIARYCKSIDHIDVYKHDLNDSYPLTAIIEGSPEDIIKLSKLLQ